MSGAPDPTVVGIVTPFEPARWSVYDTEAAILPADYVSAVQATGAVAALLPVAAPDRARDVAAVVQGMDALILAGGADVDPALYGASPHPETRAEWPAQDRFEVELTRRVIDAGVAVLGICRGIQVLNVAFGGTLVQDLQESFGHTEHRPVVGRGPWGRHEVRLRPGSVTAGLAGGERMAVTTHHHQGLDRIGAGLEVTGWAVGDDLPEAVEGTGSGLVVGVQWHPEVDRAGLIERFVALVGHRASEGGGGQVRAG